MCFDSVLINYAIAYDIIMKRHFRPVDPILQEQGAMPASFPPLRCPCSYLYFA